MSTPEYRTMVGCTSDLTNELEGNVADLGDIFYQRGMIAPAVHRFVHLRIYEDREKSSRLVAALTGKVSSSGDNFAKIIQVLREQGNWTKDILDILERKYRECGGVDFPAPQPIDHGTRGASRQTNTNQSTHARHRRNHHRGNGHLTPPQPNGNRTSSGSHTPSGTGSSPDKQKKGGHYCVQMDTKTMLILVLAVVTVTAATTSSSWNHFVFGTCHKIDPKNAGHVKDLQRTFSKVGNWEGVCLHLRVKDETRNNLKFENLQVKVKLQRCVEAYLEQNVSPCWEEVVEVLCKDLHKNVLAKELSDKYGVNYNYACVRNK